MRHMYLAYVIITGISLCILFTGCSEWSVSSQTPVNHDVTLAGFYDTTHGITVGYAGQVFYSEDGGKDWNAGVNHTMCRFGLEIIDADTAIHCGNGGDVAMTTDGGKTWQRLTNFGEMEPHQCRYLSFIDKDHGWIASAQQLGFTNDGGQTWNELTLPKGIGGIKAITLWSTTEGCLLDNAYKVYFTFDGGKTWQNGQIPVDGLNLNKKITRAPSTVMRFIDKERGIIITEAPDGETTHLIELSTTDGGKTWDNSQIPITISEGSTLYLSKNANLLTIYSMADGITILSRNNAS